MNSIIFEGLWIYHNYCRSHIGIVNKTLADKVDIIITGGGKWNTLIQNASELLGR